jgi:hypothetical protein
VVLIAVALGPVDQAQVARASESGSLSLSAVKTSLEYFESGTTVRAEHVPQAGYKLVMLRGGTVLCTTSGTSCSRQVEVGLGESVTIEARVQTGPVAAPTSIAATSTVNRPDFRSVLQARMEIDEQEVFAGDA